MKRLTIIVGLAITLAFAGCSKSDPAPQAGAPTTKADAPTTKAGGTTTATLSLNDCLTVATGNLGVIGGEADAAQKVKAFKPPQEVSDAIDTLIAKGGLKLDGTSQDEAVAASTKLSEWVSSVCPKPS